MQTRRTILGFLSGAIAGAMIGGTLAFANPKILAAPRIEELGVRFNHLTQTIEFLGRSAGKATISIRALHAAIEAAQEPSPDDAPVMVAHSPDDYTLERGFKLVPPCKT